jgi:CubicO group peptidase (beta-lactamase class C family)
MTTRFFSPRLRRFFVAITALAMTLRMGVTEVHDLRMAAAEPAAPGAPDRLTTRQDHLKAFDREVRALAKLLGLPGLVVVVAEDGKIAHQVEWGYADISAKTRVTINHIFWLASVTKTFVATLIMQMVEAGLVDLDDRMIDYWFDSFYPMRITSEYRLRHVLGHTAQGTPGKTFSYSGGRYGFVYGVFEKVGGLSLKERLIERILTPLHLESTLPGIGDKRYKHLRDRLVTPYRYDSAQRRHIKAADVLDEGDLYASAGMASSAVDLVRYAHALDNHELLSVKAHAAMTRPAVSSDGYLLPYGVGWFTQERDGEKLIWHYGYGAADSALLLRVPQRKLTLVVLANSDQLSANNLLGAGDVLTSPIAVSFVKHFVAPEKAPFASPDFDDATGTVIGRLDELRGAGATAIYDDEVFAQAFARDSLGRRDGHKDSKVSDVLKWLLRRSPQRLKRADLATLTLLTRQADSELLAAARPILDSLLASQPENPAVLAEAVGYHEAMGHERSAIEARRQLANLKGYDDDSRKQEAALWLGKHFSQDFPDLAAAYLWNALSWSFTSGNSGLGNRIRRAIDETRSTRIGRSKKSAGGSVDVPKKGN